MDDDCSASEPKAAGQSNARVGFSSVVETHPFRLGLWLDRLATREDLDGTEGAHTLSPAQRGPDESLGDGGLEQRRPAGNRDFHPEGADFDDPCVVAHLSL